MLIGMFFLFFFLILFFIPFVRKTIIIHYAKFLLNFVSVGFLPRILKNFLFLIIRYICQNSTACLNCKFIFIYPQSSFGRAKTEFLIKTTDTYTVFNNIINISWTD